MNEPIPKAQPITDHESAYIRAKIEELSKKVSDAKTLQEQSIVASQKQINGFIQRLIELEDFVYLISKQLNVTWDRWTTSDEPGFVKVKEMPIHMHSFMIRKAKAEASKNASLEDVNVVSKGGKKKWDY